MPPVRWKAYLVTAICFTHVIIQTEAQSQYMQNTISMTSDGWKPIIGASGRQPTSYHEEITHYRNPSHNSETIKVETTSTTTSSPPRTTTPKYTPSKSTSSINLNHLHNPHNGGKMKPLHNKNAQYYVLPNGVHGPHIPLSSVTHGRPGQIGQLKKHPMMNNGKPYNNNGPPILNSKRHKPIRMQQATAHSTRDEIYAPLPPGTGSYTFFAQGQNAIKSKIIPDKHFHQTPPHIDFGNYHQFSNNQNDQNIYQQAFNNNNNPVQGYLSLQIPQTPNEHFQSQNDEYTRNLVPPPPYKTINDNNNNNKDKVKILHKPVVQIEVTKPVVSQIEPHLIVNNNNKQEKIIDQLSPPTGFGLHHQNIHNHKFHKHQQQQQLNLGSDVQITKEQLQVFHNKIPPNYNFPTTIEENIDYDFHSIKRPTPNELTKLQTYEVTEGKEWQEQPAPQQFVPRFPPQENLRPKVQPIRQKIELNRPMFLPTPYKPEGGVIPTSPTQNEAFTVYEQLSKIKSQPQQTQNPNNYFDVKEVSTHYPILGNPIQYLNEVQTELSLNEQEISNEITTGGKQDSEERKPPKPFKNQEQNFEVVVPTKPTNDFEEPVRVRPTHRRRRPTNRFRTTTSSVTEETTTTESSYELQKIQNEAETERPQQRQKQRNRYRTTTPTYQSEEETRPTVRPKSRTRTRERLQEQRNSLLNNRKRVVAQPNKVHQMEDPAESTEYYNKPIIPEESLEIYTVPQTTTVKTISDSRYEDSSEFSQNQHQQKTPEHELQYEKPTTTKNLDDVQISESTEESSVEVTEKPRRRLPLVTETEEPTVVSPTTEEEQKEEDSITEEITTIRPTSSSSTVPPSSLKTHRIRTRPVKYDNSNRPRFSVKEYKQRLKQYSSTTTVEPYLRTSSESMRLRFPNRRRPPVSSTTLRSNTNNDEGEGNEGNRFTPKEPRFSATTTEGTNNVIIPEKNVKPVNTRLRPFGRFKSTTESSISSTPKVSIKPNLFSKRQRPPHLSLRMRINNKNKNGTAEETPKVEKIEDPEAEETNIPKSVPDDEGNYDAKKIKNELVSSTTTSGVGEEVPVPGDILKNESFIHSQRVSDLTSSAKNEYNTPGLFKSVSPTSRRIPSYFTISTDDPILPIEAFFPNIKDKDNK